MGERGGATMIIQLYRQQDEAFINRTKDPICIIGRIRVRFENGQWSWDEVLDDKITYKQQAPFSVDPDSTIWIAWMDGKPVGHLAVRADWNHYAWIDEIDVLAAYRGQGVGSALMAEAKGWAKDHQLAGLGLESQDTNVPAARFYQRSGFRIGGLNTAFYRHLGKPYQDEYAVFWYADLS